MSERRVEWKVGLFIFVCLALLAGLVILFSKGFSPLRQSYSLKLRTTNVGFIIPGAAVRVAGVPVGSVASVALEPDGKSVVIYLRILKQQPIHRDAKFIIEQIGFLGDQFISIVPQQNVGPILGEGDEVTCDEPFNLQEVARSAVGLIRHVDQTVQKLDGAVTRVDQILLAEPTLVNTTNAIANLRLLSERAFTTVDNFERLIITNATPVNAAMSNLAHFTVELSLISDDLRALVETNKPSVTTALKNIEQASASVDTLLTDLQEGKGLAGFLLRDEQTKEQMAALMNNLVTLSSNLNKFGLLYKPKRPRSSDVESYPRLGGRQP
jgi:phospholipid/cholesterol/gamma-HCH transport system substrate-binding protein